MDLELEGRVALVTGGASGIGAECVRALVDEGAHVVVMDASGEAARQLAADVGRGAVAVAGNVRSLVDTTAMVRTATQTFGRLDLAVNSAGIGVPDKRDVHETDQDEWRRVVEVNLTGVFLSMRAEIQEMLPGPGAIVNIASIMSAVGSAGSSAYVAAKHGVLGLTKSAALEYAQRGIRINAVGPGFVHTPLLANRGPDQIAALESRHPIGRLGTPTEIAHAVLFLLSPASSFTTGGFFPVDGGYLAQ